MGTPQNESFEGKEEQTPKGENCIAKASNSAKKANCDERLLRRKEILRVAQNDNNSIMRQKEHATKKHATKRNAQQQATKQQNKVV